MTDFLQPILINPALRLLGWLPGVLVRRIFNSDRMSKLIRFDVQPRGDQLAFHGGEGSHMRVYLQLENGAPFAVEIDRLKVEVYAFGRLGELWHLEPLQLSPGQRRILMIDGLFGIQQSPSVLKNLREGRGALRIMAVLTSKVGRSVVNTGQLEGITAKCYNVPEQAA